MKLALIASVATVAAAAPAWQAEPPLPVPRTEVAAAVSGHEILVAGGYVEDGSTTARTDLYDPSRKAWRQGPDLPEPLNHAAAATLRGAAVVVGGYGAAAATVATDAISASFTPRA